MFVASPWKCHVEHAMRCIEHGADVALEIKGGLYVDEYRPLLELAERTGRKVYPMENTLFMRDVMAMSCLVRSGALGEIVYMRGGYRHDLRRLLLDDHGTLGNREKTESVWRSRFYQEENGDLYPTHGLAPLCFIAGIGRTDRFKSLTSFASRPAGLMQRIRDLGGNTDIKITLGDVVVTQLETEKGVLLSLTHDTTLPRPRSLDFEIQGTKGIWQGDRHLIYIEGNSPYETWEKDDAYIARYEHPYWQRWGQTALEVDTHHQGMDFVMLKAVEEDLRGGTPYPASLQDLAGHRSLRGPRYPLPSAGRFLWTKALSHEIPFSNRPPCHFSSANIRTGLLSRSKPGKRAISSSSPLSKMDSEDNANITFPSPHE